MLNALRTTAVVIVTLLGTTTVASCDSNDKPVAAAPEKHHVAPARAVDGSPDVFSELGCEHVENIQNGFMWACSIDAAKALYVPTDPSDPMMVQMAFDVITATVSYNPNGDVFYSDDGGILYVPGVEPFFEASMGLVGPDGYGAHVVDTDKL